MKNSIIQKTSSLAACVLFGLQLSPALATTFTLTDGNSEATVDSMSQAGMSNWSVDGTDYLKQQWFWFRSNQVQLASIDNLDLVQETQANPNELQLRYGTAATVWLDVSYELIGGQNGSGTATLNENIRITNNGNQNLTFDFFQYSDFDLDPQGQDSVEITNGDTATQMGAQASMTEEVTSITPTSRVETNLSPNTKNSLNTDLNYDLMNFFSDTAGPGDVTSAFQWEGTIGQGGSFIITKTKTLSVPPEPIPEPSTLLLFGTGLLMAGLARLKHRQ